MLMHETFSGHTKGGHFQLSAIANVSYDTDNFKSRTEVLDGIKELFAEHFSTPSFNYKKTDIIIKKAWQIVKPLL